MVIIYRKLTVFALSTCQGRKQARGPLRSDGHGVNDGRWFSHLSQPPYPQLFVVIDNPYTPAHSM